MATIAPVQSAPARSTMMPADPAALNGDDPLTREQIEMYLRHHAERNRRNAERSRRLRIATRAFPVVAPRAGGLASPSRAALDAFFDFAARRLAPRFAGRRMTVLDIGCGGGPCLAPLERAGFSGTYIGLDRARSERWSDDPTPRFEKRLILADAHTFDVDALAELDLIVSATALEHLRDDAGVVRRFASRLRPGGAQVHYVPAEGALRLYRQHGWRQYSPACLRDIFPGGEIFRAAGPASALVHARCITRPVVLRGRPMRLARRPALYRGLVRTSLALDRMLGNPRPAMYGVICEHHGFAPPGGA